MALIKIQCLKTKQELVRLPSRDFLTNLAKIPPNQVIVDFGRGSSVESESERCPAGIVEHFELFKMAAMGQEMREILVFSLLFNLYTIVIHHFYTFSCH